MSTEIERKFLVPTLPELDRPFRFKRIRQGYLQNDGGTEVRMREWNRKFFLTMKSGAGVARDETEIRLQRQQFESLWSHPNLDKIIKERAVFKTGSFTFEIDRYEQELSGLIVVEVEFENLEAAGSFEVPSWFGPEITFDSRFKNRSLAANPLDPTNIPTDPATEKQNLIIGAIPFLSKKGEPHITTITSKNKQRIIFPKGQPESDLSGPKVAELEAFEEAGLEGKVVGNPILIPYETDTTENWVLYPFEITKVRRNWEEKSLRTRKSTRLSEALESAEMQYIAPAIEYLKMLLEGRKHPIATPLKVD